MITLTKNSPPIIRARWALAIAGNPNSGKTTLFNRLTGLRQKVANYAGVTVEKKVGRIRVGNEDIELIDLPGTYALSPRSEEERIAAEVLLGRHPEVPELSGVLCVVDSTALEKSLYLVLQILETGLPAALLLNMTDELTIRGAVVDVAQLARLLDVPVLAISATENDGIDPLMELLQHWTERTTARPKREHAMADVPETMVRRRIQAKALCRAVLKAELKPHPWSDRIDNVVMHRLWGPLIFLIVVMLVFQAIFSWAQPLMNLIDGLFITFAGVIKSHVAPSLLAAFLADGIVAGVGSVLVFLPQILIVFFFIAILENSGYMARAAMVMDRFMSRMGLQGKSFLPLMSSYACAVPGIMAARTIENKHDRLATLFIAPFMTCSARLPVYALLIGAFVPDRSIIPGILGLRAFVLLVLYAMGFMAAMGTAWFLKSSILKSDRTPFFLEIPPYRMPAWRSILLLMWDRSKIFVQRAGTVILASAIVLWCLVSFPRSSGPDHVRNSYAGRIGVFLEPALKPLGFNWKIGVGLLSAQAAREVLISSLATIYKVESKGDDVSSLQKALKKDMTPLSAMSLLVFFAFAMQCMSTLAVVRRETGGWKIPAILFVYMNSCAYVASLAVYQGGRLLGLQ